jgi:diguanylate cyclase (GGDEF)-like protein
MKVLIAGIPAGSTTDLEQMLQAEGYSCCIADNNSDIVEMVYRGCPDVVFLSANLAVDNSLGILEKLKSAPSTREIPVILISTNRARKTLAKGYRLGAYDYISHPYFKEEVLARLQNIVYIRTKTKEIESMMDRDCLTGLYNRTYFMARLSEEISWSSSYSEPLSLMMLDIDFFKKINDTYGHRCGDEILRTMAEVLLSSMRKEDVIGRYGGDEFIILMSNTSADAAAGLGERLCEAVAVKNFCCYASDILSITISGGIATFGDMSEHSSDILIGQADNALYAAKQGGRNRVRIFESSA